jgi:hypothetical protein
MATLSSARRIAPLSATTPGAIAIGLWILMGNQRT